MQDRLDSYDIPGAYAPFAGFVDALNNWYIRGARARFWSGDETGDKQAAYDTLYTVLTTVSRAAAPLMPFVAERIHLDLTGGNSVHLAEWPDVRALPEDAGLVATMDLARDVCSAVLSLRESNRRRTRLPLRSLTVAHPSAEILRPYAPIIAEAVNVKDVVLATRIEAFGRREIKVDSRIGARLGARMKDVIAAQRAGDFTLLPDGRALIAGVTLDAPDFELRIRSPEGQAAEPIDAWRGVVVLDIGIDPALQSEGWARDFVRLVQQARKNAGFKVTDRIRLEARVEGPLVDAVGAHRETIAATTLAADMILVGEPSGDHRVRETIDDHAVEIALTRVVPQAGAG